MICAKSLVVEPRNHRLPRPGSRNDQISVVSVCLTFVSKLFENSDLVGTRGDFETAQQGPVSGAASGQAQCLV